MEIGEVRKAVRELIVACEGRFGDVRRAKVDFHDLTTYLKLAHTHTTHTLSFFHFYLFSSKEWWVGG